MKKKGFYGILILTLAIVFVMALATVALAGGYKPYEIPGKYTTKPHGDGTGTFYNTSTNYCKTCHAVHLAGLVTPSGGYESGIALGDAWRLLRATSAEDACKFCHEGAAPHTNKNAYSMTGGATPVMGEHSIDNSGADPVSVGPSTTEIPDSDKNSIHPGTGVDEKTIGHFPGGGNLTCNRCHSVHGAKVITPLLSWGNQNILRQDPYGDDGDASNADDDIQMVNWCGDCHNLNPSWAGSGPADPTTNPHSHPTGTDGLMDVNGQTVEVSGTGVESCLTCHQATVSGPSNFPHQSKGHKLLRDSYSPPAYPLDGSQDVNNPQRQLPSMDTICIDCHGSRVGVTF